MKKFIVVGIVVVLVVVGGIFLLTNKGGQKKISQILMTPKWLIAVKYKIQIVSLTEWERVCQYLPK